MSIKVTTVDDYLMGRVTFNALPKDQQDNIIILLDRVNTLLKAFGTYRGVNSGYRTMIDHSRIYADINKNRMAKGLQPVSIPMGSKHLIGAAIDLEDKDGKLNDFCKNTDILEKLSLWCEERQGGWLHTQIFPPKSQKRWFNP